MIWVGGSSTNFWDDANWNFASSTLDGDSFNPSAAVNDDIQLTGASGVSMTDALVLGDGYTLTLTGSSLTSTSSFGVSGVDDAANAPSFVSLLAGSTLNFQFLSVGTTADVDATSTLLLRGTADAINSQTEASLVRLAVGGKLTFPSGNTTNNAGEIFNGATSFQADFFNGAAPSVASAGTGPKTAFTLTGDQTPFFNNGQSSFTITAVPEPSALLGIAGLAGFGLLRRRRA